MKWQHWISVAITALGAGVAAAAVTFPASAPYDAVIGAVLTAAATGLGMGSPKVGSSS